MNALVNYRANISGHLSPTKAQRSAAQEEIVSNLHAKAMGQLRKMAEEKGLKADVAKSTGPDQELGRDAFLRLLVLQMQNQDPLDPVNNQDMIAQLAQFSSLEQMTQLNGAFQQMSNRFEYFSGNLDQLNFISAQGMLGKYIEGISATGEPIVGQVDRVQLTGSIVVLTVNGQAVPMTGVMSVSTEAPPPPPSQESGDSGEQVLKGRKS
jgi:flagellar basal-body rod modification protein FlgD